MSELVQIHFQIGGIPEYLGYISLAPPQSRSIEIVISPCHAVFLYQKEKTPFPLFERMGSLIDNLGSHISFSSEGL